MILDFLIGIPMLFFILLGFRDGVVRKLVAIIVLIAGLYLGQIYMYDLGQFLSENGWVQSTNPSAYGFLTIFLGMAILQGLLYKFIAKGYKIGGFADRVGGLILGFVEGALFISSLLFIFALSGFPSRETKRDARLYKPIVNLAPQILDFTSNLNPEYIKKINDVDTSSTTKKKKKEEGISKIIDTSSAIFNERKGMKDFNDAHEVYRKNNP
jgi:uncharacterized membrane protein required for colicin V production